MLILPEKSAIFIFPPRTGSTSIKHAIMEAMPSMLLYRHAERDAVPPGYGGYQVFGVVRHPLDRMWSLYKWIAALDATKSAKWAQGEVVRLQESILNRTFSDWLVNNEEPFLPEGSGHPGMFQLHYKPETRKSQFEYLRPDLGTTLIPFHILPAWMEEHGVKFPHDNRSVPRPCPDMTPAMQKHLETYCEWELALGLPRT